MTTIRPFVALSTALLVAPLAGCDAEAPGDPAADYRAVGHVDLGALQSTPWLADAIRDGKLELDGELGPCAEVLRAADGLTFGVGEDTFEVYLEGSFDAASANACGEHIDAMVAAKARPDRDRPTPEAVLLADDLFAVFGGDTSPSRPRLEGLLTIAPRPTSAGTPPMWVVASTRNADNPVERVQAWADPSKGLDAHVAVDFADEQEAIELFGKATLGLTAMRMSDEVGDLAGGVDLDRKGQTMTAQLHWSETQMKTMVERSKARHGAHARVRAKAEAGSGPSESGIHIEIGTE